MITDKDQAVAYIILSAIEANPVKMFSWGFVVEKVVKGGLLFKVHGLIHKGKVMVTLNESTGLFYIQIIGKKNLAKFLIEDVKLKELVNVLDLQIERVDNYGEVIAKLYGLPTPTFNKNKESK